MSSSPDRKRTGRTSKPTVAVTGAAAGLGEALTGKLAFGGEARKVVGLDAERGAAPATWRLGEVTDPQLADRLSGVDTLVHLAVDADLSAEPRARTARNVRAAQTAITAAAASGVRHVVLLSTAMVYGALPDNPLPLEDEAPLRAVPDGTLVGDLLEIERLAAIAPRAHPGLTVTVLRPAAIVGPGVDTYLTRHFEAPRLLVVRGTKPIWQFCHVEDLLTALEHAALGKITGIVPVASDGWLTQEEVEELSGMRRMELPEGLAVGAAERLHRLHLTPAPASDLQYVMYPWAVSNKKLRDVGWEPAFTNEEAFAELLENIDGHHAALARRLGKKDAAAGLGAAGATVALVGTAALVRRARRKRRGGGSAT
ncbi:MAG: NAD-dependent epimerase/dehydratase family protein [Catenulispora sp.]